MAKCTIAKTSTKALLRRIGAKSLKKIPAHRSILRRSIKKFVNEQWDLEERRQEKEEVRQLEIKIAYMQRQLARTNRMLNMVNGLIAERQMFAQLETMSL